MFQKYVEFTDDQELNCVHAHGHPERSNLVSNERRSDVLDIFFFDMKESVILQSHNKIRASVSSTVLR